jgi:hypothetical protein
VAASPGRRSRCAGRSDDPEHCARRDLTWRTTRGSRRRSTATRPGPDGEPVTTTAPRRDGRSVLTAVRAFYLDIAEWADIGSSNPACAEPDRDHLKSLLPSAPRRPPMAGRNGRELPLLAQAGLTPLEAIQAATANGPLTLGPQAPRSGQLAEGYDADLIILDGDPLADITILADPAHVVDVWKAGRRVKDPPSGRTEHH